VSFLNCKFSNQPIDLLFSTTGPPADNVDSSFQQDDGTFITVARYYELQASNVLYGKHLFNGKLRFPCLPLVQVGSKKKPVHIPAELVLVIPGQSRQQSLPPEITSSLIKYAALAPTDRFQALSTESCRQGLFSELGKDPNVAAFGLSRISTQPMKVK
jgi:hypothetical protein